MVVKSTETVSFSWFTRDGERGGIWAFWCREWLLSADKTEVEGISRINHCKESAENAD